MKNTKFIQSIVSTMTKIEDHHKEIHMLSTFTRGFPVITTDDTQEELTGHILYLESLVEQSEIIMKDLDADMRRIEKQVAYFNRTASEAAGFMVFLKNFGNEDDPKYAAKKATVEEYSSKFQAAMKEKAEIEYAIDRLPKLILNAQAVINRHLPQMLTDDIPTPDFMQSFRDLVGDHAETLFDATVDRLRCGLMTPANALNYMRGRLQTRDLTAILEDLDEVLESKWEAFFEWLESTDKTDFLTLRSLYVDVLHEVVG